jgi:hypothetical protein
MRAILCNELIPNAEESIIYPSQIFDDDYFGFEFPTLRIFMCCKQAFNNDLNTWNQGLYTTKQVQIRQMGHFRNFFK